MYCFRNFKRKRDLKEAVAAWCEYAANPDLWKLNNARPSSIGTVARLNPSPPQAVTYFQPGPFGGKEPMEGSITIEGPHFPAAHTWYARCEVHDGKIVKVK